MKHELDESKALAKFMMSLWQLLFSLQHCLSFALAGAGLGPGLTAQLRTSLTCQQKLCTVVSSGFSAASLWQNQVQVLLFSSSAGSSSPARA